jgi:hypothetical protein
MLYHSPSSSSSFSFSSSSSSSSVGATAGCGLWPLEEYLSIFPIYHQLSPSSHSQHLKISSMLYYSLIQSPYLVFVNILYIFFFFQKNTLFWKPGLLPSLGKEAPNLVDYLLFPDTGYNRMGKVQNIRMCPLVKIRARRIMCGYNIVSASLLTLSVISTTLQFCQLNISQHKVISATECST